MYKIQRKANHPQAIWQDIGQARYDNRTEADTDCGRLNRAVVAGYEYRVVPA